MRTVWQALVAVSEFVDVLDLSASTVTFTGEFVIFAELIMWLCIRALIYK